MKINSYNLGMESTSVFTKTASFTRKATGARIDIGNSNSGLFAGLFDRDVLTKSEENASTISADPTEIFNMMQQSSQAPTVEEVESTDKTSKVRSDEPADIMDQFRQQLIKFLEELFNKVKKDTCGGYYSSADSGLRGSTATITYEDTYTYSEEQSYAFKTTGTVVNSNGEEISFNIDVSMSRSFYAEFGQTFETTVNLCDPLVINLDSDVAEISDQKFFFDLDSDGYENEVSSFSKGTGVLALDLNGDGIINNGKELFGPNSGDGFKDLAQYDKDKNGWIDENDDVFDKLKIWMKEEDGSDTLYTLKEKGVGAIYLGKSQTDYDFKDKEGSVNARLRSTGLFLYESGMAGTMQQVDLAM